MKLLSLRLMNFKGIREFTLDTKGKSFVQVLGENGTGKTSLKDAYSWLLFDKDSQGRSNFEIKTLDKDNVPIHYLDHEVEGVFEVDGKQLVLKKTYKEKWTKKRGTETETFSGHTTDHYIDDVPVAKKDFDEKVASLGPEEQFRVLTDPTYFSEQMHWTDRRRILLEISGGITQEEVIEKKGLDKLTEILADKTIEERKKIINARKKIINDELKEIPARIDEATRTLPDLTGINSKQLEQELKELKMAKSIREKELANYSADSDVAQKIVELKKIEAEALEIVSAHRQRVDSELESLKDVSYEIEDLIRAIERRSADKAELVIKREDEIKTYNAELEVLRKAWHEIDSKTFSYEASNICPTCGQSLPAEQVEEARSKALEDFNEDKATRLEANVRKGKDIKGKVDEITAELEVVKNRKSENDKVELKKLREDLAKNKTERIIKVGEMGNYAKSDEYRALDEKKKAIEAEIKALGEGKKGSTEPSELKIKEIEEQIAEREGKLLKVESSKKSKERIQELEDQQKKLSKEIEKLEEELYLFEQYSVAEAELLSEKVDSHFKLAKFKLFEQQVNGGIIETCETIYNGVPYSSNLNYGARVNVGLDIINTLSDHYQFAPPIFNDQAESVTKLIDTEAQIIELIVVRGYEELTVSSADKKSKVKVSEN